MKIAVYAISKDEELNVEGFMKSIGECPVYVLDTGSSDDTVSMLKKHGAFVSQKDIKPWRFDVARNEALSLVPDDVDICVSLDLDERIESGWKEKLLKEWDGSIGDCRFIDSWQDDEKKVPAVTSRRTRIHSRHSCVWVNSVHELLSLKDDAKEKFCSLSLTVEHHQLEKDRNYKFLLKEIVKSEPENPRAWVQLGYEYQQEENFIEAIAAYKSAISVFMKQNTRVTNLKAAQIWISIAQCYFALKNIDEAVRSFLHAVAADPSCREAWTHLSHIALQLGNAPLAYGASVTAINIKEPLRGAAVDEFCWGDFPKTLANQAMAAILKGA